MCGILGTLPASSNELFSKALSTLHHRGPDSSGIFHSNAVSLGHARLKIIDLSNNGAQPMHFPLGTHTNGGGGATPSLQQ